MGDPVLVGADNNIGKLGANMEMSPGQDSLTAGKGGLGEWRCYHDLLH